jgi:prevent-host-death family protein
LAKGEIKAKILEYFRYVESSGEEIIVTDKGKPSVRICPIKRAERVEELFKDYRGKVRIKGDALAPSSDEWETI